MRIGLWNIDHPEAASNVANREERFKEITDFLIEKSCDLYVLTETNVALELPGYFCEYSAESPFRSKSRFYGAPNQYCQVGIYSITPIERLNVLEETNGLLCKTIFQASELFVYGNVITIKDQWSQVSTKTYNDRLDEQIDAIGRLSDPRTLVCGDFNLRKNWPQKEAAHRRITNLVEKRGWDWPTESRTDTVQHVLHTPDIRCSLSIDPSVKYFSSDRITLSDHPLLEIELKVD